MDPTDELVSAELEIVGLLRENTLTKSFIGNYEFNALHPPIFYGLIKVHKDNKIRSITSTVNSPGFALSGSMCDMINKIFKIEGHHIRDVLEFKNDIDKVVLDDDDILVSMDVVSMYTTIPTALVMDIIMSGRNSFQLRFGISHELLHKIMTFILNECNYFLFNGELFKQKEGLPMGGYISPLAARLVMDRVIKHLIDNILSVPKYFGLFVDDSIFAINKNYDLHFLETLNSFMPGIIKFTMEKESNSNSINFLNLTLIRSGNSIITNWYAKPFASKRILNYFSSHKRSTIIATAENFIKTILFMSDGRFFESNKRLIVNRLEINNFPDDLITWLINQHYTLLRPRNKNKETFFNFYNPTLPKRVSEISTDTKYVSFLFGIPNRTQIKKIINEYKDHDTVLADSVKNTKTKYITSLKDMIPLKNRTNVILIATCNCHKRYKQIEMTRYNETGEKLIQRLFSRKGKCNPNEHIFNKHKYISGMAFKSQNKYYLKYL